LKNKLKKIKNKTIVEQVYEILEEMIIFSKIKPDTILTESEISEMVGAGRTPVREALRILAKESFATISRMGVFIPPLSGAIQLQLLEVKRAILKLCVQCSINRLTELDKKNICGLLDILNNDNDIEFLQLLKDINKTLANCSKNKFIYKEFKNMESLFYRFWFYFAKNDDYQKVRFLYIKILESIFSKNLEETNIAVDDLIDFLEIFVRKNS
jgi:DNA-binding GntR family transcriptional regulator